MGGITGRDWVRIVASGLLAEAVIIAIFVVVALAGGRAAAMYSAVATSFAVCFAFGFWSLIVPEVGSSRPDSSPDRSTPAGEYRHLGVAGSVWIFSSQSCRL